MEVWNQKEQKLYEIEGDVIERIQDLIIVELSSGTNVGKIAQKCARPRMRVFSDLDTFILEFPENIDVATKALLIGASVLVDYIFFDIQRYGEWRWTKSFILLRYCNVVSDTETKRNTLLARTHATSIFIWGGRGCVIRQQNVPLNRQA